MKKILLFIIIFSAFFLSRNFCAFAKNVEEISIDQKIGQMIMTGFHGTKSSDKDVKKLLKYIKKGQITGVLLLKYNVENPEQLKQLVKTLKSAEKNGLPLLIAVDEEGGKVQRLSSSNGFMDFLSAKNIAQNKTPRQARGIYADMAEMLKETGINLNLAPCVDVDNPNSPAIGKKERSLSNDSEKIVVYSEQFIDAHNEKQVLTALKHFPGHGNALSDTHLDFTDITNTWRESELTPYLELIKKNKANIIMSAHVFNNNIDEKYPASLSYKFIQEKLRNDLGFSGTVITDDLQMGAVSKNYGFEETIINAVNSGSDILLFANYFKPDIKMPVKVKKIILKAVRQNKIKKERIEESYNRIKLLKESI